jgi:hypothetical protein
MGFFSAQILQREICFYYGTQIDQQTTFLLFSKSRKKVINNGQKSDLNNHLCTREWMDVL